MHGILRRDLLSSGLALSASSLIDRSAWAKMARRMAGDAQMVRSQGGGAIAPREQLLFDFGWKFTFGHNDDPARDLGFADGQAQFGDFGTTGDFAFAKGKFDDSAWHDVKLPHDWAVELPYVHDDKLKLRGYKPLGRTYPETSVGWYRREFDIPASDLGRRITIEFDGVSRSCMVFVNGCFIGRNENGYTPFHFDVTDFLSYGQKNYIAVRVDASITEGWFYQGAGIYRHVWLTKTDALHLGRWESTVRTALSGNSAALSLSTSVENAGTLPETATVRWQVLDPAGKVVAIVESRAQTVPVDGATTFTASARLDNPALWSVAAPNLYSAIVTVQSGGRTRDADRVNFGVRTAVFDASKGFLLNGKSLKIQGTCNHQDHAGVGTAMPDRLQLFRLNVLKEMGCNAVRSSHNMPTPEWVEACDRMGVMMMCETRQMSSNPEGLAQLETMVKRYRNSPSIILWSMGNEEWRLQDDMGEQGVHIGTTMVRRVHELDPTRVVSGAVAADNEKGVSLAFDVIGFNYRLEYPGEYPEVYHQRHPDKSVYGSETASGIYTRGEYFNDPKRHIYSAYDERQPNWSKWDQSAEQWWTYYDTHEWEAGGFAWTGFDYREVPTADGWPSVTSQFGIVDICGFPKDVFYYYKSWWGREPVLHLLPHWNFEGGEGETIPVWVHSNLDEVELFVNGTSLGSQKVPRLGHVEWSAKYAPGSIEVRGSKDGKIVLTQKRETTGQPVAIRLTADRMEIAADGEDIAVLKVEALDAQGRAVPTAGDLIHFNISGEGQLIGVGNGNPNSHEGDKEPRRSLFNGLAQVIVQANKRPGTIHIEAVTDGSGGTNLAPAQLTITTKKVALRPSA
jgi:beta-galactosidase